MVQIVIDASSSIKALMNRTNTDLERELDGGLGDILEAARRALGDGGIEVNLRSPDFELGKISGKPSSIRITKRSETRIIGTRTEVTHRLANFLDPFDAFGWGKKEVDIEVDVYVIDRDEVIGTLGKGVTDTLKSYRRRAEAGIEDWRRHADENFSSVRNYLDRYNLSLIDGLRDRNMERERREQVLAVTKGIKKMSDDSRANLRDFETATNRALNGL